MEIAPRIDLPLLLGALTSADDALSQNAGRILGYHVCRHEEHRDALAAQQDSLIEPLIAHLSSRNKEVVQNATLLLGQCLYASTEFRQIFDRHNVAAEALVTAMQDQEVGVIVNATWAVRNFFSDAKCTLSESLLDLVQNSLLPLLVHKDAHVQKHASKLDTLVQQRREHLKATMLRQRSDQDKVVQALPNTRDDRTMEEIPKRMVALDVLAALTTGTDTSSEEECSPTIREHSQPLKMLSPTKTIQKHSPRRVESWKKAMALKFSAGCKNKFHAAVSHAAAG